MRKILIACFVFFVCTGCQTQPTKEIPTETIAPSPELYDEIKTIFI